MLDSSESWLHQQQQPYSRRSRAGGGAVHSIRSGHAVVPFDYLAVRMT
jgi:hypothetical protein